MKILAIVLLICICTNFKKTFGLEHNSINKENARGRHTFYITTNVNISGGNTVIKFGKYPNQTFAIKHPNCPLNEDPIKPTHLPYPGDCGKFYKCSAGYAFSMNCPAGLEWSIELDRCDHPEIAKCDPYATTTIRTTTEPTKKPTQPSEGTTSNSEKPIKHPNCPLDEDPMKPTHLPFPGNCAKFYKCSSGYAHPMDCPVDLEWSIELDRCDYSEIAKCDPHATTTLRTTTEPTKEPTQPSEGTTSNSEKPIKHPNCPVNEDPIKPTHLPYPGNCAKFYKCSAGYAFPMNCPAGLEWSIELDRCDYPEIAKCDPHATTTLRTTTEPTKEPTQPSEGTTSNSEKPIKHPNCPVNEDPIKPTHLPYPGNCAKFYKCSAGYAFPMNCPVGLEWSIELDRCDYPEIAKCDPHATTTLHTTTEPTKEPTQPSEGTTSNSEKPIKHPNCPVNEDPIKPTHLPYPGNCAKFYKCSAGYAFPMNCPVGLEWSIELDRCDFPEIAKCDPHATTTLRTTTEPTKEPTQPSEGTTSNSEKPIKHPNCLGNEDPMKPTHLPYPGNCAKFYKCSAGYAFPMNCPVGLEWSIELDRCDFPEIAKCDPYATTTLHTTTEPTKEPTQPSEGTTSNSEKPIKHPNCLGNEDPMKPTHLPYPGNCAKFYKCCAGYAFPMDCPSGLEWSIELDRCDYPEVAKCDPHATTTIRTTSEPTKEPTQSTERTTPNKEKPIKHPNCPEDEDPMKPTHLPFPGNCAKFYKCSVGYAFPVNCPAGLEWSIELDRCDYPEIAKCDPHATTTLRTTSKPTKEPTQPTEGTTSNSEKPKEHPNCPLHEDPMKPTHLPYPGNCAKFYKCSAGYAFPMDCPAGQEWSIELDRCDYPEIAKCDPHATTTLRTTTEPTKKPTQPTEGTTSNSEKPKKHPNCPLHEDPMKPTHLPYPGNCAKFYKCSAGYAFPMDCPAGQEWSIVLDHCDYPEIAKCDPYATTTLKSLTVTPPDNENEAHRHPACPIFNNPELEKTYLIYLPYPKNCSKYLKCSYGFAVPRNCPHGLHWSTKYSRCEWPYIARCIEEI